MKLTFRISLILFLVCLSLNLQPKEVQAFPPLPSSFYGTVKLNGVKVADGTLVEAVVNGKVFAQSYTQMYEVDSVYTISIPGEDPGTTTIDGAKEGDAISFKIGGIAAQQEGTWHSGTNEQLDLIAVTSVTPNTPAPTPTSYPTQTAIPPINTQVPTAAATITPTQSNPTQSLATATTAAVGGGTAGTPVTSESVSPGTASPVELTATGQPAPGQAGASTEAEIPAGQEDAPRMFWLVFLAVVILGGIGVSVWLLLKKLKE